MRDLLQTVYAPEARDSVRAAFVAYIWRIWFQPVAVPVYAGTALALAHGHLTAAALLVGGYAYLAVTAFVDRAYLRDS
jgi:hypothetical protein